MRKKLLLYVAAAAGVLVVAASIGVWYAVHSFMTTVPEEQGREVHIRIRPGSTFDRVAWQLRKADVITDVDRFRLLARYRKQLGAVRAGEFVFSTGWTPDRVLEVLVSGIPVQHRLQLREGLTWWETARAIEEQGFARAEDLKAVFHDPEFLKEHGIPFENAEGFLFPETYLMDMPEDLTPEAARSVASRLVRMFRSKTAALWPQGLPEPDELRRILTIATLVEKETSVPEERARVAGGYTRRLEIGMLMQADPTIIYGIGPAFDGNITRAHLRDAENPYNTYVHRGLPPGPICSPGLEALRAAVNPERHSYLYFVSRKDGTHHFSKTLEEHNAAVRKYQLGGRR